MSLINQVLQDLDARQAEGGKTVPLPSDVRPLPVHRPTVRPAVLGGLLAVALVVGAFFGPWRNPAQDWLLAQMTGDMPAAAPALPAPTPAVVPPAGPVHTATPASAAAAVPEAPPAIDFERSLRLADTLQPSPAKRVEKRAPAAVPAVGRPPAVRPSATETASAVPAEAPARPAAAAAARKGSGREVVGSIERSESVGTTAEQAENEYRKAIHALNLGRGVEAREGLRLALRLDSQHAAARQLLVRLLLEDKQRDEAVRLLHEGLQEMPMQTGWAMTLARLQMDRGDPAAAWQTLALALPVASGNADYQGFAGHVLQRLGRSKEAAEHYLLAARLSPGDGRWWLGLGLAYEAEGRNGEAREAFLRAKQSANLSRELVTLVEHKLR